MNPYFYNDERIALLHQAAVAWRGTPFRKGRRLCGAGVDCVNLAVALYDACGLDLDVVLPHYGLFDGACRVDAGPIIHWLENSARFARRWRRGEPFLPLAAGDLLCLNIDLSVHHLGVALDGLNFFHIMQGHEAGASPALDSTYVTKLQAVYRPVQLPQDDQHNRFKDLGSRAEEGEE